MSGVWKTVSFYPPVFLDFATPPPPEAMINVLISGLLSKDCSTESPFIITTLPVPSTTYHLDYYIVSILQSMGSPPS